MISDEPDFVDREDEERRYRALSLVVPIALASGSDSWTWGETLIAAERVVRYLRDGAIA